MRLLVVEDEPDLGSLLQGNLGRAGMAADLAPSLADAEALLGTCAYDLIVLDRRLPDGSGIELIRRLRTRGSAVPVIMLTAADSIAERVEGLSAGADDYVVKPFAIEELVARIRAALRRPGASLGVELTQGNVVFNTQTREVRIAGAPAVLARRELAALESLMRADGRVVTRDALEDAIYSLDDERQSNAMESNLSRLRRHLEAAGADIMVRVVRGIGYRLERQPVRAETGHDHTSRDEAAA